MPDRQTAHAELRRIPAVGVVLGWPSVRPLIERHGKPLVTRAVRGLLDEIRASVRTGQSARDVTLDDVAAAVASASQPNLRRVINATGVVVHTNLGRAPLAQAAIDAINATADGYSNLELDLEHGRRGSRHAHASALIAELFGAEDGIAVNNCASAVMLMLAAHCRGREVIVARGELVEIGGGFRVPDVMRESGATLVEVGTTNKVRLSDYADAINENTAAILVVHRSNFAIVGFTAQPEMEPLAELSRERGVALMVDVGSGLLADPRDLGEAAAVIGQEPRPKDVLRAGADLVCFSGDKLLGGPQAGIIAGHRDHLAPLRKHPLARAMRADKTTCAALEATLRLYRDGRADEIPVIAMLAASTELLQARAERLLARLPEAANAKAERNASLVGGGALPQARLPTVAVTVGPTGPGANKLAARLRAHEPAVMGRIVTDRVGLDLRTVQERELEALAGAVTAGIAQTGSHRV